ncbi:hypothetical protein AU468_05170 [Alkalispirochaeta sphaeroplastigenens]|uniref:HTH gntR-type domain-containing protein n=1 Tax=Alkalispirochaeta sphaeroplastigenens TaxID=1187066 RepID=A0A2S4JVL8_9SPIO|nr:MULTISPECIES: GntR family transcriptional regulator [Alkalispirochaeta]POR03554.1 hypothetical protein AU468_05170 [Alkalispirochaeta sphaeroplastigenens]
MLDVSVGTPLYEQLKQALLANILQEVYPYGQRLPSEAELSDQYKVSRITVRRAVAELIAEGYLTSQQGKGTFVKYKREEMQFRSFGGFTEWLKDGPADKRSIVLSKNFIGADAMLAAKLHVPVGERLLQVRRLMYTDHRPHLLDRAFFIDRLYPGIEDLIFDDVSTFELMWHTYHQVFVRADKTLGAVRAGIEEAEHLGCVPGDPLLWVTKIIYGQKGVPIHYSSYYVPADSCVYTLSVTGEQSDLELRYPQP